MTYSGPPEVCPRLEFPPLEPSETALEERLPGNVRGRDCVAKAKEAFTAAQRATIARAFIPSNRMMDLDIEVGYVRWPRTAT